MARYSCPWLRAPLRPGVRATAIVTFDALGSAARGVSTHVLRSAAKGVRAAESAFGTSSLDLKVLSPMTELPQARRRGLFQQNEFLRSNPVSADLCGSVVKSRKLERDAEGFDGARRRA
jgi:hypothetical protein